MEMMLQPQTGQLLGEAICTKHGTIFNDEFYGQYFLEKSDKDYSHLGWNHHHYAGWALWHSAALPVATLEDKSGKSIGLLWGIAIGPSDELIRSELTLPIDSKSPDFIETFEQTLTDIRGKYVVLLKSRNSEFLYGDPVGDMGILFDTKTGIIGSSIPVVLRRQLKPHYDNFTEKDLQNGTAVFRFGATPDRDVKRLTPNHKLNLKTYKTARFWPFELDPICETDEECLDVVQKISKRLAGNLESYSKFGRVSLPISGGYDSRVLLLLAQSRNLKFTSVFTHRTNWISGYDAIIARGLCDELGIDHEFLDAKSLFEQSDFCVEPAKQAQIWNWIRAGFAVPMERRPTMLSTLLIKDTDIVLRGNVMEMLGGRLHNVDLTDLAESIRSICGRDPISDFENSEWSSSYKKWANGLPNLQDKAIQDLCFIENLYCNALSVVLQSMPKGLYVNPFADRQLISLTMRYPSERRIKSALYKDLMQAAHPTIPFPKRPMRIGRNDKDGKKLNRFLAANEKQTESVGVRFKTQMGLNKSPSN